MRDDKPFDPTDWTWDKEKGMYFKPCIQTIVGITSEGKDIVQTGFWLTDEQFEAKKRNMSSMEKNNARKSIWG